MNCAFPFCKSERIWRDGLCYDHWRLEDKGKSKVEAKKPAPIKKVSDKRKPLQKEYKKLVKEMLGANNKCEVRSPVCTGIAQGLNHREKRSERNLTERDNVERCCHNCNSYIESHTDWALANGHLKLKHKIS